MPHYRSYEKDERFGKITVKPKEWYRRFFRLGDYSLIPYFAGSKIEFALLLERLPEQGSIPELARRHYQVCQQVGDGTFRICKRIKEKVTEVEGVAEYTGDTKFFIALRDGMLAAEIKKKNSELFYENVIPVNQYMFGATGWIIAAILGIIGTIIAGIILGFLHIRPFWEIWIP